MSRPSSLVVCQMKKQRACSWSTSRRRSSTRGKNTYERTEMRRSETTYSRFLPHKILTRNGTERLFSYLASQRFTERATRLRLIYKCSSLFLSLFVPLKGGLCGRLGAITKMHEEGSARFSENGSRSWKRVNIIETFTHLTL